MKSTIMAFFGLLIVSNANAASPSFLNISADDMTSIVKDMSANSTLSTVMPASTLGSIFGVEVGLTAGTASSPNIDTLTKRNAPSASVPMLPHAGIMGGFSIPFGFTFDFLYTPEISGDIKYSQTGLGVKYNLDLIPMFNFAIKGFYSTSKLNFNQTVTDTNTSQQVNATIGYTNTMTGFQVLFSPSLPMFEPYIGLGYATAKGNLGLTGATVNNFYSGTFNGDGSANSTQIILGMNLRLALLVLGAEYQRVFDTSSITGKLSLRF